MFFSRFWQLKVFIEQVFSPKKTTYRSLPIGYMGNKSLSLGQVYIFFKIEGNHCLSLNFEAKEILPLFIIKPHFIDLMPFDADRFKTDFAWVISIIDLNDLERLFMTIIKHINMPFFIYIYNINQLSYASLNYYELRLQKIFLSLKKLVKKNNFSIILEIEKDILSDKKSALLKRIFYPNIIN